jgi:hypothetical protein
MLLTSARGLTYNGMDILMDTDAGVHVLRKVVIAFGLDRVYTRPPKAIFFDW